MLNLNTLLTKQQTKQMLLYQWISLGKRLKFISYKRNGELILWSDLLGFWDDI